MPRVAPFEALVYDTDVAGPLEEVTARPYDVINEAGRRAYAARSPFNVVRVDLPDEVLADGDAGYGEAARRLDDWRAQGVLRLTEPGYVAYEMHAPAATVRGVVCALELEPWGGAVVPHEEVMDGPVQDRLQLLRATATHLSAIYGAVAGPHPDLEELLATVCATTPSGEVVDQDGVRHRIWHVPASVPFDDWVASDRLLIADGHHRYTTALAYRDERHRAEGSGPWDRVLAFVVDAGTSPMPVLPYHRIQRSGPTLPDGRPVSGLAEVRVELDDASGRVAMCARGADGALRWTMHDLDGGSAVRALHTHLDVAAPDDAIAFTPDAETAVAEVEAGRAVAAYLLPPTTPERILEAVAAGDRLPRKSTFFWPKPRTGMVMFPLETPAPVPPATPPPAS